MLTGGVAPISSIRLFIQTSHGAKWSEILDSMVVFPCIWGTFDF